MRKSLSLLVPLILLAACTGEPTPDSAATLQAQSSLQTATSISATITAMPTDVVITPTLTATPGQAPLTQAVLSRDELNGLLDIWTVPPVIDNAALEEQELCFYDCLHSRWVAQDGLSWLEITMVVLANRDEGVIYQDNLRVRVGELQYEQKDIPAGVFLPQGSWISDATAFEQGYQLYARNGAAVIVVKVNLANMNPDQNILFASLYGESQIAKLKENGY